MDELEYRFCAGEDDGSRKFFQDRVRYCLAEARRAIAFAQKELILKNRSQYADWMGDATWLLTQAAKWRELAKRTPWRDSERKCNMVVDNSADVGSAASGDNGDVFAKSVESPIIYRRISDTYVLRTLLRMRTVVWNRHYSDTITLLCRKDPNLSPEAHAKLAKEYKDEKSPNYNKLSTETKVTFKDIFNNELLLALCNSKEEQGSFKADIDALAFYQELINKFRIRDIVYETKRTSTVKPREWQYRERKGA